MINRKRAVRDVEYFSNWDDLAMALIKESKNGIPATMVDVDLFFELLNDNFGLK